MKASGKKVVTLALTASLTVSGALGWSMEPAMAGGGSRITCNGTQAVDQLFDLTQVLQADPDIQFNLGVSSDIEGNRRFRFEGWGAYTTYADGVTPTRDQQAGHHNKIFIALDQSQVGKSIIIQVQIGRGQANDAGQILVNGNRPLCSLAGQNDYGNEPPSFYPYIETYQWSAGANCANPLVVDFNNQAANNPNDTDQAGVAGTGEIKIWFR